MPSYDVIQILRSKTTLSESEIIELSDEVAWDLIYKSAADERAYRESRKKVRVCFTGFSLAEKVELEEMATNLGFTSVQGVSKSLAILVLGDMPGESKIAKAKEFNTTVLQCSAFLRVTEDAVTSFNAEPESPQKPRTVAKLIERNLREISEAKTLAEGL